LIWFARAGAIAKSVGRNTSIASTCSVNAGSAITSADCAHIRYCV
jgi:hypothetical protein